LRSGDGAIRTPWGGKVRKERQASSPLRIVEEEHRRLPSKGGAAMIRKVYEVDPLKLMFVAEKPPPEVVHQALLSQERLWEAEPPAGYFPDPPAENVP
jgi:hypothetical protein